MTSADNSLLEAIQGANKAACVRLLEPLDEKARRQLYPAVARRAAELDAELNQVFDARRLKPLKRFEVAGLALLGTASLAELKKTSPSSLPHDEALRILTARRPAWLADWANAELTARIWSWKLVRALVRGGLIPKPATQEYAIGLLIAPKRSVRELVKEDPALLEDELWRLFEHEGTSEVSLAACDKYGSGWWLKGFCALAADGVIDRARLLSCSLDALARDFTPFRAAWFSRLHEALEPTGAERARFRQCYLDLLSSRVPATVSFAMKALGELDKAGALDLGRALDSFGPALEARDKGTVQRSLALLAKAVKRESALRPRVAELAARALGHESADVQLTALALVEPERALIEPYLEVLAPSVRAKLGVASPLAAPALAPAQAAAPPSSSSRVTPVDGEEELVELFATVLENQGPPMDIERVLDGVARLPASERLTAGLAKRAAKVKAVNDWQQRLRNALAALALAWTRRERTAPPDAEANLADFLLWRIWNLAEQVATATGEARPPFLSLPTWPDGRIDPAEFKRRLNALPKRESAANDRHSLAHLDWLLARLRAGLDSPGAEPAAKLPQMRITWTRNAWEYNGKTFVAHEAAIGVASSSEATATKASRFDPAALTTARLKYPSLELQRWCATVSPVWREGWYAAGCCAIGSNLNWDSAQWANRAYLEPLAATPAPAAPLGPMGALLIALALSAKEPGEAMLAVDSLLATLAAGGLDAHSLGSALIEAASSGAIKFARWSKQLAKAAQAGPAPAAAIFRALELLFESGQGAEAADYGRLIELALELAHLTGQRLSRPGAMTALARIGTGGKTRKALAGLLPEKDSTPA